MWGDNMKKEIVNLIINGSILTILTTPIVLENININEKPFFSKITFTKEQLYSEYNLSTEPRSIELKTNINTLFSYIDIVKEYCMIFGLDSDIILDKISSYTDNFSSDEFINNNQIYDYGMEFDNKEQAIIYFLSDINNNYTKYGLDDSIFTSTNYVQTSECEEMVEKYSEIFGIDKKIPMSIIYTESHYTLSSYNFRVRNNPGGMGHTYYKNLEVGIIYKIISLKYGYNTFGLDDISFFRKAQYTHCPDNDGSWITFNENYYRILEDDYYHFMNERTGKVLTR